MSYFKDRMEKNRLVVFVINIIYICKISLKNSIFLKNYFLSKK